MRVDADLASIANKKGCPHCGARLHFARYARKGRIGPDPAPEGWANFHGLCCAREGCRKRVRPMSVRFAGRSPHAPMLVLLALLLRARGALRRVSDVCSALLVSERTVKRWLRFWERSHASSRWWRELASLHSLSGRTVTDLWKRFAGASDERDVAQRIVRLCSPLWSESTLCDGTGPPAEDARSGHAR